MKHRSRNVALAIDIAMIVASLLVLLIAYWTGHTRDAVFASAFALLIGCIAVFSWDPNGLLYGVDLLAERIWRGKTIYMPLPPRR